MKVLFLIGGMYPGGAERQLVHLCNKLCGRGWQVKLVTVKRGDAYQDDLDSRVTRITLGSSNPFVLFWRLVRLLRNERSSVLVPFLFHATLLGRVASFFSRTPCISSYRNVSYGSFQRDALIRLTSCLDAVTLSNVAGARGRLFPVNSRRKLYIIPNMYLGKANPHLKLKFESVQSREGRRLFQWCFIGRLQPQKNIVALLYAFKQLSAAVSSPVKLSIAGDGQAANHLKAEVERLGLSGSVVFLGHIDKPEILLQESDALVLPSLWEGMPNVLMEAMSVGTPCVATPVGAVPDMLGYGARGVLSDDVTPYAISAAMDRLMMMEADKRQAMIASAQQYISQVCDVETVVDQWECILRQASHAT